MNLSSNYFIDERVQGKEALLRILSAGNSSFTQYQTNTDADGNVTGYTHITTSTDTSGNSYSSTNHYDANWNVTESAYTDGAGNSSFTQYQTNTDADGNVTGYTHITTSTDTSGNSYSSTNHYDANWNVTESAYTDGAGNSSFTQYQTNTDADGNVTGYTHITTSTDTSGNSYSSTNHYDANWNVTESAYTDGAGNSSFTQYQTNTDADGNVTGYTHITTSTDTSGNSYSSTNHYDANWNVTESAYTDAAESNFGIDANNDGIIGALSSIDSSGSVNLSVDAVGNIFAGNVAVKTDSSEQIHTGIYGSEWAVLAAETIGDVNTVLWQHESGALHTWQTDANWQWVNSDGWWESGSAEFDAAESNFGIDANNDGIIGALSSIELKVSEVIGEEIVPVICIGWRDEDLFQFEAFGKISSSNNGYFDVSATADFEIGLVGVASIAATDFVA